MTSFHEDSNLFFSVADRFYTWGDRGQTSLPPHPFAAGLKARMHVKSAAVRIVEIIPRFPVRESEYKERIENREGDDGQEPRQRAQAQKSNCPSQGFAK